MTRLNLEWGSGAEERGSPVEREGESRASSRRGERSRSKAGPVPVGEEEEKKRDGSRGPSIAPRTNRSAMLRAATMEKTGTNGRAVGPNYGRAFK
jgi:hypothetical protein